MITYRACFTHNRIYHPKRMNWELKLHELPRHTRIHLEATRCDLCPEECHDTTAEDIKHLAPPLTKPQ